MNGSTMQADPTVPVMSMRIISDPSAGLPPMKPTVASSILRPPFLAPRRPRVPRHCHIRISNITLAMPLSKSYGHICISARIRGEKVKSILVSGPVPIRNSTSDKIPLDIWFSLAYMHRLKGPPNILQIAVHRCKDDGRHLQLLCHVDLPLDRIMQMPIRNTPLELTANKNCAALLDAMIWTSKPPTDTDRKEDRRPEENINIDSDVINNHIIPQEDLDAPSSASATSEISSSCSLDHDQPYELHDVHNPSKNPFNALMNLRPTLYSKMKLVRQSGSKMIDRLRNNLRRRSLSTSDEDAPVPEGNVHYSWEMDYPIEAGVDSTASEPHPADDLAYSDLLAANYPDITTQIETISSSFSVDTSPLPYTVIFVDRNARQARQLLDWSSRAGAKSVLSFQRLAFFGDCQEADTLFSGLTSSYKQTWPSTSSPSEQLRIGIAGDDASISMIARSFVQLMARDPRQWLSLKFYIIPLSSKGAILTDHAIDHAIAERIALSDPQYRSLFGASAWENALDGRTTMIEPVGRHVEDCISRYMLKADGLFRLPIAEAMLEIDDCEDPDMSGVGVSIPVIRDFSIIDIDYGPFVQQPQANNQSSQPTGPMSIFPVRAPKPLVIEYWAMDKKVGKVSKFTLKTAISSMRIFRLPFMSTNGCNDGSRDEATTANSSDPETPPDATYPTTLTSQHGVNPPIISPEETLHMIIRFLPKDKNKFLQRFGAYSPKRSGAGTPTGEISEKITKFVCLAPPDAKFTACIDGLALSNCKFGSLTPLWPTRMKAFPIAIFKS